MKSETFAWALAGTLLAGCVAFGAYSAGRASAAPTAAPAGVRAIEPQAPVVTAAPAPVFGWRTQFSTTLALTAGAGQAIGPIASDADKDKLHILVSSRLPIALGFVPADVAQQMVAGVYVPAESIALKCSAAQSTAVDRLCTLGRADGRQTFVLTDMRQPDLLSQQQGRAILSGLFAAVTGVRLPAAGSVDAEPNAVQITLQDWRCLEHCPAQGAALSALPAQ